MFNNETYINNRQCFNYNINAVSGTLRKSHPKSIITKVDLSNSLLDKINPKYVTTKSVSCNFNREGYYNQNVDNPVVVLQVMLCGDNSAVVEFVLQKDFETISNEI